MWDNMLPNGNDLFWKWKAIYEELQDPFTETIGDKYFSPILEAQLKYCKKIGIPLSIAILNISASCSSKCTSILETYSQIRNITNTIRKRLSTKDMIFYNGGQTFLFLFPKTNKENIQKLIDGIETDLEQRYLNDTPLAIKGGYAEFPTDANGPLELQECARKALTAANQSTNNRIIGYFTERRKNPRVPLHAEVRYTIPDFCERLACSRNLSEIGIMLSGMPDLPLGEGIRLIFNLPDAIKSKITVLAKTTWNKISLQTGKQDIGLCFTYINDTAKEQIRRFITNAIPPFVQL